MPRIGRSLDKIIAATGRWPRREVAGMILRSRVTVNGKIIRTPAQRVDAEFDTVAVDGERLSLELAPLRLWRYHKPVGIITTRSDPQGRPTVFSALPESLLPDRNVVTVGRLDVATEGLLLLSSSGPLARLLELPSSAIERTYLARLATGTERGVSPDMLRDLEAGLVLPDGTRFRRICAATATPSEQSAHDIYGGRGSTVVRMTLVEGKKHEVRRAWAHFGFGVTRLIRNSFGPFQLGTLQPGEIEELPARQVHDFAELLESSNSQAKTLVIAGLR